MKLANKTKRKRKRTPQQTPKKIDLTNPSKSKRKNNFTLTKNGGINRHKTHNLTKPKKSPQKTTKKR